MPVTSERTVCQEGMGNDIWITRVGLSAQAFTGASFNADGFQMP